MQNIDDVQNPRAQVRATPEYTGIHNGVHARAVRNSNLQVRTDLPVAVGARKQRAASVSRGELVHNTQLEARVGSGVRASGVRGGGGRGGRGVRTR